VISLAIVLAKTKRKQKRSNNLWGYLLTRASLLIVCLAWSVPTLGLLITSFRPASEITTTGWWTVFSNPLKLLSHLTLENYRQVIFAENIGRAFINTVIVTVPTTVLNLTIVAFAAYGFAWIRFKGKEWIYIVFIIALLIMPFQVSFIPLLQFFSFVGLSGSFLSIWLAHTAFGIPINVYVLRSFMETLPEEIIQAAAVDGASHFGIFWRIAIPLALPAIASLTIFQFLSVWNDFLIALVFLGGGRDVQVMTITLQLLMGNRGQDWHLLTSGAFVTMAVPLLVFFALQKYFVRGLTGGAIKG
jgi:alpha-glucoside transport system permease protein